MKSFKPFLLFLLLCNISSVSYSQHLSAGPHVGINISTLSGANDMESKVGLNAGGFLVYSVKEHFGISLDLLYSSEGAKYSYALNGSTPIINTKYDVSLHYLRIPLQANFFLNQYGDVFRPKITLGPSFGFLLNTKRSYTTTITDNGTTVITNYSDTNKDAYNSVDVGGIAGLGFNYRLAEALWLNFDADYYFGFTDVPTTSGTSIKNNVASVSLGLAFGIGKEE
jgi:hypothetical protein